MKKKKIVRKNWNISSLSKIKKFVDKAFGNNAGLIKIMKSFEPEEKGSLKMERRKK